MQKFPLAGKQHLEHTTFIKVKNHTIGGNGLTIMAGPCAIESAELLDQTAAIISKVGVPILRGGAFKPRTSPYDFQGLGRAGLELMAEVAKRHHLITVSEVLDTQDVEAVAEHIDILQIGARNMQNFALLKAVGKTQKPILLKRGYAARYEEFLFAAEYILQAGNSQVILCERGIRSFETLTRNTLDLNAVPMLQQLTHLPVMVDPSHGTGMRSLVAPLAKAAIAVGAQGVIIEVHPTPDQALSDGQQTLHPHEFTRLVTQLRLLKTCVEDLKDVE